jgi:hypothetical protein
MFALINFLGFKLHRFIHLTTSSCAFLFLVILGGCSVQNFNLKDVMKSDVDEVADHHYMEIESLLRELTVKLYKRNPKYLRIRYGSNRKTYTAEDRLKKIFELPGRLDIPGIPQNGIEAMEFSLDNSYQGDRVFVFMAGLTDMIRRSYGYQHEFFVYTRLKEQDLYLSARNLETALWRITTFKNSSKEPLILTNSRDGEMDNLSYERLFGKMIATQDMLAKIMAGKNNRMIKTVVQNVATKVFFPF